MGAKPARHAGGLDMASPPTSMADELYRAAVKGDVSVLSEEETAKHGEAYYKDPISPTKNNIVHIAARHGQSLVHTGGSGSIT